MNEKLAKLADTDTKIDNKHTNNFVRTGNMVRSAIGKALTTV